MGRWISKIYGSGSGRPSQQTAELWDRKSSAWKHFFRPGINKFRTPTVNCGTVTFFAPWRGTFTRVPSGFAPNDANQLSAVRTECDAVRTRVWVKVSRPTRQEIGRFGDVLLCQSLGQYRRSSVNAHECERRHLLSASSITTGARLYRSAPHSVWTSLYVWNTGCRDRQALLLMTS